MSTYVAVFALVLAYFALVAAYLALRTLARVRRATAVLTKNLPADTTTGTGTAGSPAGGHTSLVEALAHTAEHARQLDAELRELRGQLDASAASQRHLIEQSLQTLRIELTAEQQATREHVDQVRTTMLDEATRSQADLLERAEAVRTAALADIARNTAETEGAVRHTALLRYDAFAGMSGRMSFSLALLDDTGTGVTISALAGPEDTRVYAKAIAAGRGEHELSPEEAQAVAAALGRHHVTTKAS